MNAKVTVSDESAALTPLIWMSITQEVQRDFLGMDTCRMSIIGAQRRKLGEISMDKSPVAKARDGLIILLQKTCRECPYADCDMKEWVFTG